MSREEINLNIAITFRHTHSSEALKTHANEKLSNVLKKYFIGTTDASVVLSVEKRDHVAEIHVHSKGTHITAKESTSDLYSSIDKAVGVIETQARKIKDKHSNHKGAQDVLSIDEIAS